MVTLCARQRPQAAELQLTLHEGDRAWKGFDWKVLNRLHEKGLICDPINHAKSIRMTEEGLTASTQLFEKLFVVRSQEGDRRE
ncbi:DUF6429 family protein [Xanthomonas sp. NCPPB 2632]|uniref:DUF6429 family protein n=1 Tax=Xanthomonas sp. NCPPB 2632 TaxID=3240912 RepID=UPI0035152783